MRDPFHYEDQAYGVWLDKHPNGFVMNANTSGRGISILHRARCSWIYPLKPGIHYTANFWKVCDDDRTVIEQWAVDNGHTLTDCKKCLA